MNGKAFLIVGATGMGKSTVTRQFIQRVSPGNRLIYDVNQEYTDLYNKPLIDFDEFSEQTTKVRNALIVYEEATIFLSNRGSDLNIRKVLVSKRWRNNTVILNFHSFRTIPKYIYLLCNYIIILKTNDSESYVESAFDNEKLTKAFRIIQSKPLLRNGNKTYSPNILFDIYGR